MGFVLSCSEIEFGEDVGEELVFGDVGFVSVVVGVVGRGEVLCPGEGAVGALEDGVLGVGLEEWLCDFLARGTFHGVYLSMLL